MAGLLDSRHLVGMTLLAETPALVLHCKILPFLFVAQPVPLIFVVAVGCLKIRRHQQLPSYQHNGENANYRY
jgi:hypothetical protein